MQNSVGIGHFVGAMTPEMFFEHFMEISDSLPPAPEADFSRVSTGESVQVMCEGFIRAVEKPRALPGMQMFQARTTRKRAMRELPELQPQSQMLYDTAGKRYKIKVPSTWTYPCPAIVVKLQPTTRRSTKRKRDTAEYYDFATSVLDIEVHNRPDADPFVDPGPEDSTTSGAASQGPERPDAASLHHSPGQSPCMPLPTVACSPFPESRTSGRELHISSGVEPYPSSPKPLKADSPAPASLKSSYYAPFENRSELATALRASILSHAAAQFSRQHRTFVIQVVLFHRWARFIRWDRSGAVVTERFDYVLEPHVLAEFLWRFAHMTNEQRGFDPSVELASRAEKTLFEDAVREFLDDMKAGVKDGKPVRKLPGAEITLDDARTYPTWKVHVVDASTRKSTEVVVRRPFSENYKLFGRATRAYIAFDDVQEHRLLFMKDTWRADHSDLHAESKTYRDLRRHHVPHVPEVLYGGDVRDADRRPQETLSQVYAADEDAWRITAGICDRRVHHRIVQEIAYPLESALDDIEYIQVFHDVLLAIDGAFNVAGLLHRDISIGNVMIRADGRGILNDWDHAGKTSHLTPGIGTWQFMSSSLLRNPDKLHELVDDLESVFWVFAYGALKYYALPQVLVPLAIFDEEHADEHGRAVGGRLKNASLDQFPEIQYTSHAIKDLISDLSMSWFKFRIAQGGISRWGLGKAGKDDIMRTLELADKPCYWRDKFATVLRKYHPAESASSSLTAPFSSRHETRTAPALSTELVDGQRKLRDPAYATAQTPLGIRVSKRKVLHEGHISGSCAGVRRSKRLNSKHVPQRFAPYEAQ